MKGKVQNNSKLFIWGIVLVLILSALLAFMSRCSGTNSGSSYSSSSISTSVKTVEPSKCKVNLHFGDSSETVFVNRGEVFTLDELPSSDDGYFAGWSKEEKEDYIREDIDYSASEALVVFDSVDLFPVFLSEYTIVNNSSDYLVVDIVGRSVDHLTIVSPGQSFSYSFTIPETGNVVVTFDHNYPQITYEENVESISGYVSFLFFKDRFVSGILGCSLNCSFVDGILVIPSDYLIDPMGMFSY